MVLWIFYSFQNPNKFMLYSILIKLDTVILNNGYLYLKKYV